MCILLLFVTFGIYSLFWYFKTHEEMKRHSGLGMGGGLALLLAFFVGFVMPYLTSSEVGDLYERSGRSKPVSGATGLWYFPGMLYPDRPDRVVRQDERCPERVLAFDGRPLIDPQVRRAVTSRYSHSIAPPPTSYRRPSAASASSSAATLSGSSATAR